jgi:protein SCO1
MKQSKEMKSPILSKAILLVVALGAMAFLGWRVWSSRPSDKLQKPLFSAPKFSYMDRSGRAFSSSELKGKVWVVDFIFSHCAGSCPMLSQKMKTLQEAWKGNPDFKLVTFTVDPAQDTVTVLKQYADDYHADPAQWFFLTGKKADIYLTIRQGFKEIADRDYQAGPGFEFIHSTRMVLVDGDGKIRGLYDGENDEDVKKLKQDIKYLLGSSSRI